MIKFGKFITNKIETTCVSVSVDNERREEEKEAEAEIIVLSIDCPT
jgi:hypothetical protein